MAERPLDFGILPPYRVGVTANPDWMSGFVRHAEELGFESVYVVEHVAVPAGYAARYPYSSSGRMPLAEDCNIPDPLELLAYLAAVTTKIVLATGVLVAPLHHPVQLAKRLATIDVLSKGRMRLGVGVGWMREELETMGVEFRSRGRRTDELIAALRALWLDDPASFSGEFFRFDEVRSFPHPHQPGGVPIHTGGHSRAAARRAGRLADGYHPIGLDRELLRDRLAILRSTARQCGRDPDAIELSVGGTLAGLDKESIRQAVAIGATRVVVSTATMDLVALRDEMSSFARRFGLKG